VIHSFSDKVLVPFAIAATILYLAKQKASMAAEVSACPKVSAWDRTATSFERVCSRLPSGPIVCGWTGFYVTSEGIVEHLEPLSSEEK
jgi:hypothetical protein